MTHEDASIKKAQILYCPTMSLTPYKNNPRVNKKAVSHVAMSIETYGFRSPILIKEDGEIINGHTRWLAAQELGLNEVPTVTVTDLSETKIRGLRLADNRVAQEATWDTSLLALELTSLKLDDFDLALTGFTPTEINSFLIPDKVEDGEGEDSEVDLKEDVDIEIGDIFTLGGHSLMCGNSTNPLHLARLTEDRKMDMLFTDPPYGISVVKKGKIGASNLAKTGTYAPIIGDDSTQAAVDAYRLATALGIPTLILWGGNYYADQLPPSSGWIVWDKRSDSGIENNFADGELAWTNKQTPTRIYRQLWNGMIREGESDKRIHPTQKPVALAEWCFERYGDPRTVLDMFGGSGSALIACENTKRACYMMELSPAYCDMIIRRWEKHTGKKALRENGEAYTA